MVTNKKRIQAYVNLSTYESLKSLAEDIDMSLSEYVGELLQTQSVASHFDEIVTTSSDGDYVTKEQLLFMFKEFRSEIERKIIREVNRAEISWEERATVLTTMNSGMLEMALEHGFPKENLAKHQKGMKKFRNE